MDGLIADELALGSWVLKLYAVGMSMFEIIVLSLVQGLTEFVPVSSSGHLLATRLLFDISDVDGTAFDAFLHLGTLLAVLLYYRKVWLGIARGVIRNDDEGRDKRELFAKISIATVPAAVMGYLFQEDLASLFRSADILAGALVFTAIVLWGFDALANHLAKAGIVNPMTRATYLDSALIGLVQILALFPGVSRSGVTIAAGRWRGLSRKQAANFSFLMSAPIIAGAGLSSFSTLLTTNSYSLNQMLVAFLVSFVSGYLAIAGLLKVVEKVSLMPFAIYLVALAVVLVVYV